MNDAQKKLRSSWRNIMGVLLDSGYYDTYREDIARVANVIRKEIGLDYKTEEEIRLDYETEEEI